MAINVDTSFELVLGFIVVNWNIHFTEPCTLAQHQLLFKGPQPSSASGFGDEMIFLWDTQTRGYHCIRELQGPVDLVNISTTEAQHLVSSSISSGTSLANGSMVTRLNPCIMGHISLSWRDYVTSPLPAPGYFMSRDSYCSLCSDSGGTIAHFHVAGGYANQYCFSPNEVVVTCSTIQIWDNTGLDSHLK